MRDQEGLKWQGLGLLPVFPANPGGFEHAWQKAAAAVALYRELPEWELVPEREIRLRQYQRAQVIAAARAGRTGSHKEYYRPDFTLTSPAERVTVVEVELTPKDSQRMERICRGWMRTRHVEHVYYLASPRAAQVVRRAAEAVRATDFITILDLDDVSRLAALERKHADSARDQGTTFGPARLAEKAHDGRAA